MVSKLYSILESSKSLLKCRLLGPTSRVSEFLDILKILIQIHKCAGILSSSNFCVHLNHLEGLTDCWAVPSRVSDSVILKRRLRTCVSNNFPDDSAHLGITLWKYCLIMKDPNHRNREYSKKWVLRISWFLLSPKKRFFLSIREA